MHQLFKRQIYNTYILLIKADVLRHLQHCVRAKVVEYFQLPINTVTENVIQSD